MEKRVLLSGFLHARLWFISLKAYQLDNSIYSI